MNEDTWLRIDRSGFFPNEHDSETNFILAYKELLLFHEQRPSKQDSWLVQARKYFYSLFHSIPCWVSASVSKKGLLPWELAACWQWEDGRSELQVKSSVFQMNDNERTNILFHELIHASRARIQSLCFEEVLAYEAMKTRKLSFLLSLRCWLSRLFISPSDPLFFLIYHILLLALTLFGALPLIMYGGLVGFFWVSIVGRAFWLDRTWKNAFRNIEKVFPGKGWRFFLRATDRDILWLASLSSDKVFDCVMQRALHDWRWNYLVVCALS